MDTQIWSMFGLVLVIKFCDSSSHNSFYSNDAKKMSSQKESRATVLIVLYDMRNESTCWINSIYSNSANFGFNN